MSQQDMIISDGDGASVLADLNLNLQALASTSKGNAAPTTPYAGQLWLDDNTPSATVWTLSCYDGADWIKLGEVNITANTFAPYVGAAAALSTAGGTLTGSLVMQALLDLSHASAGQIQFPATQNASANANTLDDYEEGTFTPAFTFATPGNLTVVYSQQIGRYTKIGRLVTADFSLITSTFTHTTASGIAGITGMPFTSQNATMFAVGPLIWQGINTGGVLTNISVQLGSNATSLEIVASGSGQSATNITTGGMPTGGTVLLRGSITYTTA